MSIQFVYYPIEGATAGELRRAMDQLGLADRFRQRYDSWTEWYVSWSYSYAIERGHCATGPVQLDVKVTFALPQWDPPAGAAQALRDRWQAYMTVLQTHEDGHKEIAIQAGSDVLKELEALPAYPTCAELEAVADAAGERVLDRYREQERSYDRMANQGATQGVRFP